VFFLLKRLIYFGNILQVPGLLHHSVPILQVGLHQGWTVWCQQCWASTR